MQLAIAGVVRRSWRDALAGDGRPNRRSHNSTSGCWSATVGRVRLRGRMVRQRRSRETDGRAGCSLRKGKSRMGPAQKADKELLLGDHLWPGLNGEIPAMSWTVDWKYAGLIYPGIRVHLPRTSHLRVTSQNDHPTRFLSRPVLMK